MQLSNLCITRLDLFGIFAACWIRSHSRTAESRKNFRCVLVSQLSSCCAFRAQLVSELCLFYLSFACTAISVRY